MKKLDFKIWDNESTSPDDIPLFIDTNNLIILDKDNIPIIDMVIYSSDVRLDKLCFQKYGGSDDIEQFNIVKRIIPLILIYNEINDITQLTVGSIIKFPDLNSLTDNIYYIDDTKVNGINFDTKKYNNSNLKSQTINKPNKINGLSGIDIELDKIQYDQSKGVIYF